MSELGSDSRSYGNDQQRYAMSGKIMLSAIIILFTVVILIICLHIYARWFLERARRRQQQTLRERRRRAHHIVFANPAACHGLEPSLLKSLPTFVYSSVKHEDLSECAVCLSEFEENEQGRLLPKCNHSFHTACIDMWFHSHSTCPLCRAPIEANQNQIQIVIDSERQPSAETSCSVSALCPSCEHEEVASSSSSSASSSSSVGSRRKVGVSIEVPRRTESFKIILEEETQLHGSPFKSPGGRILSFKRMLSRDRRPSTPVSCSSGTEIDMEMGEIEEEEEEERVQIPSANQTTIVIGG